MTDRTVSRPRIYIEHPRRPAPSRAYLGVIPDWLKGDLIVTCDMTEEQLIDLAAEALRIAVILRNNRSDREPAA